MCSKQGRDKEAVDYLAKEIDIYERLGVRAEHFPEKYWTCWDAMAQAYSGLHNRTKEIECYLKAIDIIMNHVTVPPAVSCVDRFNSLSFNIFCGYR